MPQIPLGGVSFNPAAQREQMGPDAQKRMRNPVQESVQTLNYRLPKVFGARAPANRALMAGAGGMGQFGGGGGLVAQVLAALAGLRGAGGSNPALPSGDGMRPPVQAPGFRDPVQLGQRPGMFGAQPAPMTQPAAIFSQPLPVSIGMGQGPGFTVPTIIPEPGMSPAPMPARQDITPTDPYAVGPTAAEDPSNPATWLSPYERVNGIYAPPSQGYFDGEGNWVP